MLQISSYIICQDEEASIITAIQSLCEQVDEIIIVDTGSIDQTIEKIQSLNIPFIKLYRFKWCNDFSAARNYALSKTTHEWVIALDADEFLQKPCDLRYEISNIPGKANSIYLYIESIDDDGTQYEKGYSIPRLFKKNEYFYSGMVHEQLIAKGVKEEHYSELTIQHSGYTQLAIRRKLKLERNFKLSLAQFKDNQSDEFFAMYLIIDWAAYANAESIIPKSTIGKILDLISNERYFNRALNSILERYLIDNNAPKELEQLLSLSREKTQFKAIRHIEKHYEN